jgi:hypothetical protein
MPPRGGWESPRFDAVQNPHPPIDPVAEAAEYAAGITGNPTSGESANAKNDHAKAQVFHERMARFHEARGEQNHAAAHKAASTAHQSAAAFDKGSYRRGVTGDQLGSNARDCSVRANHVSGFGRGFGGNDMTPPGQPIMSNQLPADHGSKGTGRYQLVDRQTGTSFDVEVPDHVNFTKDQGPKKLTPQPIKMPPLKSRTVQPQTMRGTTRDNWASPHFPADAGTFKDSDSWASPHFPADAGTSAGARKAAQTRASGGAAAPMPAKPAVAAPKPAAPKPAVAAPTAALKPAAPKPLAAKAVHAAANAVTGASHAVRGAARGVGLVARGINAATRYQERYG